MMKPTHGSSFLEPMFIIKCKSPDFYAVKKTYNRQSSFGKAHLTNQVNGFKTP